MKKNVISGAIERIKHQKHTPISPCSVDDKGNINLCTAASVAFAGLLSVYGQEAATNFENALKQKRDVELLYSTFDKLGWERQICSTMKIFNDSVHPDKRTEEVIRFLSSYSVEA